MDSGGRIAGLSQKSSDASGTYWQLLVTEMKKERALYPSQIWKITQNKKVTERLRKFNWSLGSFLNF